MLADFMKSFARLQIQADFFSSPLQLWSSPAAGVAPPSSAGECFLSEPSAAAPPHFWPPDRTREGNQHFNTYFEINPRLTSHHANYNQAGSRSHSSLPAGGFSSSPRSPLLRGWGPVRSWSGPPAEPPASPSAGCSPSPGRVWFFGWMRHVRRCSVGTWTHRSVGMSAFYIFASQQCKTYNYYSIIIYHIILL